VVGVELQYEAVTDKQGCPELHPLLPSKEHGSEAAAAGWADRETGEHSTANRRQVCVYGLLVLPMAATAERPILHSNQP
jgi:hypothetical protein